LSQTGKVGITLIGLPGSGKSALAKRMNIKWWRPHDHDDNWLEDPVFWLGKWWVAQRITNIWDTAFLWFESNFTIQNYGRKDENKPFSLENTIFASSGSLVRSPEAMQYIRDRTFVILIDTPIERVLSNINKRPDGSGRIIGMNGWPHGEKPMHATLEEELRYREALYQQSCDAVFLHQKDMDIDILAKQFEKFVIQVIENSTLRSA
jgi:shikimate kinase